MKVIAWNMFRGYYVASENPSSYKGWEFHYWAETIEECEQWIKKNEH